MKQNLTDTEARGAEIHKLQDTSDRLDESSYNFRKSAKKVKRKMCMSNLKWWFVLAAVVALIILVSVVGKSTMCRPKWQQMLIGLLQLPWKIRRRTTSQRV